MTQPLLLEQLREWDVQISSGQLNHLMQANQEAFCQEKNSLLETALAHSDYITVDDSGARHKGKNGYVTHMGNKWFGWFCSTPSKSRLNFLTLLCAGEVQYRLSPEAFDYMQQHKLPFSNSHYVWFSEQFTESGIRNRPSGSVKCPWQSAWGTARSTQ